MAVYERASAREQARDQGRRILVLGVGLLDDFAQAPFCAVLAHEYGHFSHRDTAGGEVALRVRQDMMKFAAAMVQHGQAVWWNLAFQFLRLYSFLFRRISHGATRLQEVLADRLAARHYSARHFEDGLRHVIRRSIEFNTAAQHECTEALQARRALQNLYALRVPATPALEQEIADTLSRPTSEDDTHPGPLERFRLLTRVRSKGDSAAAGMVWDLFANRDALSMEMTGVIDSHVKLLAEHGGGPDSQDHP
jgi:Zn-dependent protease with chaperone function